MTLFPGIAGPTPGINGHQSWRARVLIGIRLRKRTTENLLMTRAYVILVAGRKLEKTDTFCSAVILIKDCHHSWIIPFPWQCIGHHLLKLALFSLLGGVQQAPVFSGAKLIVLPGSCLMQLKLSSTSLHMPFILIARRLRSSSSAHSQPHIPASWRSRLPYQDPLVIN